MGESVILKDAALFKQLVFLEKILLLEFREFELF